MTEQGLTYRVLKHIKYNNASYKPGDTIRLPVNEAVKLLGIGAIVLHVRQLGAL